ncbi:MAG: TIGR00159 family protein [Proteobacteria bacterium]|jgi:diadenylate cyclase|nr:TIGR00159 family protein [Pseudomonadota bacterium]
MIEHSQWFRYFLHAVDVALVAILIYSLLRLVRGTRTVYMIVGVVISFVIYWVSSIAELYTLNWILYHFLESLLLILVILFQNEIRRFLTRVGQTSFIPFFLGSSQDSEMVDEVVRACFSLANKKIGALIVIEKDSGLGEYVEQGIALDANVTKPLLTTIFQPSSPLHDGAVMIQKGRLSYASCFLPLTMTAELDSDLGTRHRAAVGITEETDAIALVVSEEKGWVSVVMNGKIIRGVDGVALRKMLNEQLRTKISQLVMPEETKEGQA